MPFHNTWSLSLRFDVRPSVSHSEWIWDYVKSFSLVPSITMIVHFWKVRSVCSKEGEWQAGWKSWCNEDKRMGPHMPILHGRVHWSVWDVHSDHRGLWQDSSSLQLHLVILHPSTVIGWILTSVHFETGEESEKIGKKKKKKGPLWCYYLESSILVIIRFPWEDPDLSHEVCHEDMSLFIFQYSPEAQRLSAPFFGWWDQSMDIGLRPNMLVLPWLSSTLVSDCQKTVRPWLAATVRWRKWCAPWFLTLSRFDGLCFLLLE